MSYVFKILNAAGQLQVSGDRMVPQFIDKVVADDDNIRSQQGADFGFESRSYSGTAPDFGGRPVIIFWTLPPDVWWFVPSPFMISSGSGSANTGMFAFCPPGAVINGTPEGYVFALETVQHSGVQPALRFWNEAGALMFDSGTLHLAIETIASDVTYPYDTERDAGIALPGKPAFLVPYVSRNAEQFDGFLNRPDRVATHQAWTGLIKRVGNTVYTRMIKTADFEALASNGASRTGYSEDQTSGNTSGLLMPVINAALYD